LGFEYRGLVVEQLLAVLVHTLSLISSDLLSLPPNTDTIEAFFRVINGIATGGISQAHYPEVYFAWLMAHDGFYTANPLPPILYNPGITRRVGIKSHVDVNVYGSDGRLVASIIDNVPQYVGTMIESRFRDGERIFFLPADGDFTIQMLATGDGDVSVTISEQNLSRDTLRLVSYINTPVTVGDRLTVIVPAFELSDMQNMPDTGSSVRYVLLNNDNVEISGEELLVRKLMFILK